MTTTDETVRLIATVLDCPDPRELAEFYGRLLGWEINEAASDPDWVELAHPTGGATLAFQLDPNHVAPTWPNPTRPMRAHLDVRVPTVADGKRLADQVGAVPLPQPADRQDALFRVYADPAGHPFCLCAARP